MKSKPINGNSPIVDGFVIWIEGERLLREHLVSWIDTIPMTEASMPDFSKEIYGPGI